MSVSFNPLTQEAERFISQRTGINYSHGAPFNEKQWFCATIRNDEGVIIGVILCEFVNWFEAHFNAASDDPRSTSRRLLRAVFTALFSRVVRLTAFIDTANARAVRNAIKLGFVYEGFCRMGINGQRDAFTFGMLKGDCKLLPGFARGTTQTLEYFDGQGHARPAGPLGNRESANRR
jgi:RimJ/RimL family protein N-acetyltransferase